MTAETVPSAVRPQRVHEPSLAPNAINSHELQKSDTSTLLNVAKHPETDSR
jgi:hypothetical protein